jgi:calcineurin-like phosphoesterase family protein
MEYFLTSDWHLRHQNILKHSRRLQFMSEEERRVLTQGSPQEIERLKISRESSDRMNDHIIDQSNNLVGPDDVLWMLGDFVWAKPEQYVQTCRFYLNRIKCRNVYLVWGNHDPSVWQYRVRQEASKLFKGTYDKITTKIQGRTVVLNHEAMAIWDKRHHGSIHCYGHSHSNAEQWLDEIMPGRFSMDIGIDNAFKLLGEYRPFSFDEIADIMKSRPGFGLISNRNYHHNNDEPS